MRSTFKQLFYINRAKVKTNGTTAVLCRISIDGKQAVLTTGIYCQPCDWNAKKGIIKIERENNRLIEFRNRVRDRLDEVAMKLGNKGMSASGLIENMVIHHLKTYEEDIEFWRKL